jgi:diketogulonate reductase-like aldo/keto reductase
MSAAPACPQCTLHNTYLDGALWTCADCGYEWPAAADTGTAVLVMRPFEEGALFRRVKGKPLPAWAADLDCTSWAQLFLKFIIGHPAVTCPIPATSDPKHLADNIKAGFGRLPDAAQRRAMIAAVEG